MLRCFFSLYFKPVLLIYEMAVLGLKVSRSHLGRLFLSYEFSIVSSQMADRVMIVQLRPTRDAWIMIYGQKMYSEWPSIAALYTNSYLLFHWRKQYFSSKQNFIRKQGALFSTRSTVKNERLRDFKTKLPPHHVFGNNSCFISFLK
jgi:hypothetical protein